MTDERVLAGKVLLITGGGRGIGAACARYAAALGATVVVNDVDAGVAEAVASSLAEGGGAAIAAPCDVGDWDAVDAMVTSVVDRFGRLDGLVNNAAVLQVAPMELSTPDIWAAMLRVNLVGVAACGQLAARQMTVQGSGSIVNITSGAQCGLDAMSVYGATKAGVASLTYTWAIELENAGVRVNAVSPRGATRMSRYGSELLARRSGRSPVVEPPPEVNAPVVAYLLSDLSEGVTGQVVRVEGRGLQLMTHPAVSVPEVVVADPDVASVSRVFDASFRHRLSPPGVVGLEVSRRLQPGDPGWRVGLADLPSGG